MKYVHTSSIYIDEHGQQYQNQHFIRDVSVTKIQSIPMETSNADYYEAYTLGASGLSIYSNIIL